MKTLDQLKRDLAHLTENIVAGLRSIALDLDELGAAENDTLRERISELERKTMANGGDLSELRALRAAGQEAQAFAGALETDDEQQGSAASSSAEPSSAVADFAREFEALERNEVRERRAAGQRAPEAPAAPSDDTAEPEHQEEGNDDEPENEGRESSSETDTGEAPEGV